MFPVSRKCNTTVCILSLDIPYSAFPNSNSWQFSYPFCPSQGIFPSSAVQSPLSLPCNNRSVSWPYRSSFGCHPLDVLYSRRLGSLSMDKPRNFHRRLCVMFSIFVDDDGHKRGQTSRPVVGVEIQTNCNCKAHPCHFSFLLDCIRRLCFMPKLNLPHNMLVRLCSYSVLLDDIIRILHKDF